jgi:predicted RNase H-like nuclease (RuvC/YqgF family)
MLASRAKILSLIPTICVYCNTIFMYSAANRVPSTNQVDPQENNRENKIRVPDLTFDTKGQLRSRIENLYWEKNRDKEEIERLNEKLKAVQAESDLLRESLLKQRLAEIEELQQRISPPMRVAI